jgi:uncharacterized protein (DUF362 family)/Pyruvate/2-oxoacid:ferredoxin oxidoreductase delta subunit
MSKVFIIKCLDYNQVATKLPELIEMMGGAGQFVQPGEKLALKPNLLLAADPAKAVTTHPTIVAAAGKIFGAIAKSVTVVESPGAGYTYDTRTLEKTYQACGIEDIAESAGIALNYDTSCEPVSFPEGKLIKRFEVITPLRQADSYINLCKLKSHGLMYMTGAVKNIFGAVPGRAKPGYHGTMTTRDLFAGMLLDLAALLPPTLSIMDAVVGMEGEGPGNGTPRQIGLLMASTDPLSLDLVASAIMGIPEDRNPLFIEAKKRGMHPSTLAEVEIIGASIEELRIHDFKLPATFTSAKGARMEAVFGFVGKTFFSVDPKIIKSKCVACGACKKTCPRNAIRINRVAKIEKKKCIRCYCCHEMCRYEAIELHRGLLYRVANRKG